VWNNDTGGSGSHDAFHCNEVMRGPQSSTQCSWSIAEQCAIESAAGAAAMAARTAPRRRGAAAGRSPRGAPRLAPCGTRRRHSTAAAMVPVRFRDAIVRMLSVSIECSSLQRSVRSSNVNGAQHDTALFSVGGMPAGSGLRSV
jgi:hypothetical protein